jgi:hypothetical protein
MMLLLEIGVRDVRLQAHVNESGPVSDPAL